MKRIISLLIAVLLLLPVIYLSAVAAETKTAYEVLYQGMLECDDEINIYSYGLDVDSLIDLMENVLKNEPMLFHLSNSYGYSTWFDGTVYAVLPQYEISGSDYTAATEFVNSEVERILSYLPDGIDDYEKAVFLHDYLCVNYAYDTDYAIYDIYNMLLSDKGVCMAYSLMYDELLSRIGIESRAVISPSTSLNHMWNEIQLGGVWYEVDVTWDDPLNDKFGRACHSNLLLSDDEMHASHDGEYDLDYPCTCIDFDDIAWNYIDAPFGFVNGDMYMFDYNVILSVDLYTGVSEEIFTVADEKWYSTSGSYLGYCIGFGSYNDKLYYNSKTSIMRYDPIADVATTVYTPDADEGMLIGLYMEGNIVHYLASPTGNTADATEYTYVIQNDVHKHTPGDEATCTEPQICTECGEPLVDALGHTEGEWVTVTEAQVGVIGLKEQRCTVCGELLNSEDIPALEETEPDPDPDSEIKYGDVDDDGNVSSLDYLLIKRNCFGTYILSPEEMMRSDVDKNDIVDALDYLLVKRIVFGTYTIS